MNDKRGRGPRPSRAARLGLSVAGIALLAGACGGGSSTATGQTVYQQALAYSACMRAHGEPTFPDPDRTGDFPRTLANRSLFAGATFATADQPCHKLLPPSPALTASQEQEEYRKALSFAVCLRSHGFPTFPDPTPIPYVGFDRPAGIDASAPQFILARETCHQLTGFGPGA